MKYPGQRDVKVVQKADAEPLPTEIIAQSIKDISDGVKKIRAGRLNDKALVFLIHKSCGVSQDSIRLVLNAMNHLEREFLK